jgi:hypothetical protein
MSVLITRFSTSDGINYFVDDMGIIHQETYVPFTYDENYCSTYDTDLYRRESEKLQALRYGFAVACHGRVPGKILDFGCGNLAFVDFANQHTNAIGYDIAAGPGKTDKLQPASVITFWDALEHVPDLDSTLNSIECDTVIISLPWCHYVTEGLQWFNSWKHRKPNEHLHHFNPSSLMLLLESHGYRQIAISYHEDIIRKGGNCLPNILSMGFRKIAVV